MSENDPDLYAGLFVVPKKEPVNNVFCWPTNIEMLSMPPPVKMRVVSYSVRSDHSGEQPKPDVFADKDHGELYVSSKGQTTFTFTIGTREHSVREITNLIRRHFFQEVMRGNIVRDYENAIGRMKDIGGLAYELDSDIGPVKITDIKHVVKIGYNVDQGLVVDDQQIYLRMYSDDETLEIPFTKLHGDHEYVSNRELIPAAKVLTRDKLSITESDN